jgi:hypothetical protein
MKSGLCHLADKVGLKLAGEYGVHDTRATRRRNVRLKNKHQDRFGLQAVLRIWDILVRFRFRRSVPLTSGSGSCYFPH